MRKTRTIRAPKGATIARLLALVRPHWPPFCLALVALAVGSGINLLFPEVIRRILENERIETLAEHAQHASYALVILFALQAVAFYFRAYLFGTVGQRVVASVRRRVYETIILQPVAFFDASRAADLVSRLNSDTLLLQDAVSIRLSVFLRYSAQVLVGIVLMSCISLTLTITIVILLPILVGLSLVLGRRLRKLSRAQQAELGKSSAIAQETFEGVRLVKSFNKESYETRRFSERNEAVLKLGMQRSLVSAFFQSFISFLLNCSIIGVLLYGVHLVTVGTMALGDLTAFLLYGLIVAVSFAFLAGGYTELIQSLGASERVFEILDLHSPAASSGESLSKPVCAEVEFSSVSFAYPSRPDVSVLANCSIKFPAGKTTALVGPSGAGKSTIINLLLALYQPTGGSILFDGKDLRELNINELRDHCALVPQEQALFAATIAENLRYGKESATIEELKEVCRKTNLLSFIESLPQGFETEVGERGVQLSTGQKQRLAIARALLRDPALLILDEATSALDSENEHLIQQALQTLLQGRTAVVIAHRLSTIKNAGKVVVLERGKVVQEGTHDALSHLPGLYRQLVERQELIADGRDIKQA